MKEGHRAKLVDLRELWAQDRGAPKRLEGLGGPAQGQERLAVDHVRHGVLGLEADCALERLEDLGVAALGVCLYALVEYPVDLVVLA